jgi:N-acetylglucosamine-6-phosphate deacetylase
MNKRKLTNKTTTDGPDSLAFKCSFLLSQVSDAVTALGLEDGRYVLGQMEIEVKGYRAVVAGTETLCGAIASLFQVSLDNLGLLSHEPV